MRRLAPAALLLAAACGGPLFAAVVEIPYACVTQRVDVPPAPPVYLPSFTLPVAELPLLPPLLRQGADLTLRVTEADVTAVTPGVDLGGVESLSVRAVPPGSTCQPGEATCLLVASYQRPVPPPSPPPTRIVARGQNVDVADYLLTGSSAGKVQVLVSGSGTPPTVAWQADLRVCVYGKGTIPYF